jgi:tight adherence protein C
MPMDLIITLCALFTSVALVSGAVASRVLSRTAPEVKRLRPKTNSTEGDAGAHVPWNSDASSVARPSKPLKVARDTQSRLQRRLALCGWDDPRMGTVYRASQVACGLLLAVAALLVLGPRAETVGAACGLLLGWMTPDVLLSRRITRHKREIQDALPDALDLLVVCVEAGSSLDQAILRASEELEIALPRIAQELRTVAAEIRAGKPRLAAFQDFAKRTNLDDVRALVAMLIQTDRFGTSVAQALRTHADTSRTRRRQLAEERAGKVGVKLVFPLVLCLLPALYIVCLGPVGVRLYRTFF